MPKGRKTIPVIDIFAGPGGLSEGFNSLADSSVKFASVLAVEKDSVACSTLRLRCFFHQFEGRSVPEEYYKVIRGEEPETSLDRFPEWSKAAQQVWNAELGVVAARDLHSRIEKSLNGARDWVLLGGPPCQAYSLVGRSRMTGVGQAARDQQMSGQSIDHIRHDRIAKFSKDVRHTLYREYLRIVAVHQPAVFVMENVKGILSAKIAGDGAEKRVFAKIRQDLSSPWDALSDDPDIHELGTFRKRGKSSYRLYSFVVDSSEHVLSDRDFLIKSEEFGVPQARHRVVLLGVRNDLKGRPCVLSRGRQATVRDAIGTLPPLRSGISRQPDSVESWAAALRKCFSRGTLAQIMDERVKKAIVQIANRKKIRLTRGGPFMRSAVPQVSSSAVLRRWITDRRIGGVVQHESRMHMSSDLGRYLFAATTASRTGRSPKLPAWPHLLLPEHQNVSANHGGDEEDDIFVDRFKVQLWDKPSSTVTSHIAKDGHYFIHPDPRQCRSLTVREAARLQTFPDNYFFRGNRTQQYQQVGNAVPPFLAAQMAKVIADYLPAATADAQLFDRVPSNAAELLI